MAEADIPAKTHVSTPERLGEICNDSTYEMAWAFKAAERASVHMNLLLSTNTKELKLHKKHGLLYEKFRELFPDMNVEEVDEKELKGENKKIWFTYCEHFRDEIEDYNLATIMRVRADGTYSEENTIVVPKVIFLAIETARNREGLNEMHKATYKKEHEDLVRAGRNVC